jgi:hypothetical protein
MPAPYVNGYRYDAPTIIRGRSEIYAYDAETKTISAHGALSPFRSEYTLEAAIWRPTQGTALCYDHTNWIGKHARANANAWYHGKLKCQRYAGCIEYASERKCRELPVI